jgi:hypothetical protein
MDKSPSLFKFLISAHLALAVLLAKLRSISQRLISILMENLVKAGAAAVHLLQSMKP